MSVINSESPSTPFLIQSPYLYCQAAGSDESDGTKGGIHLRWDLMKELGYNHIPKGNLAHSGNEFDKENDYIGLYRSPFTPVATVVDFTNTEHGRTEFLSNNTSLSYTDNATGNIVIFRFLDRGQFSYIRNSGYDSHNPLEDFFKRYRGIIEIEIENKLMFSYEMNFDLGDARGSATVETISIRDRQDARSVQVVKREMKGHVDLINPGFKTFAENIKYFRVQHDDMLAPEQITMYTYEDMFDLMQSNRSWDESGNFSLSLDDNEVFTWFQGSQFTGTPELSWPKYNDGSMLKPDNYWDRWREEEEGLRRTIEQFIDLNNNGNPRANINLPSSEPNLPNGMTVSLLDLLKMVALDYHAARMMGLGYLDTEAGKKEGPFVYAAVYTTIPSLPGTHGNDTHIFLTLPTEVTDLRLPVAPRLESPTYGLYAQTDLNSSPELISDPNGYSFYENVRFINLNKINLNEPQPVGPTIPFAHNFEFDATTITQPVAFGIEYKEINDAEWRKPELLHDDIYFDQDGIEETTTTPEHVGTPLYAHRETSPGIHQYALYSVNWFSRISGISNIIQTDETVFPKRNTLLPPLNLAVQYIQEEDPLIFTTAREQQQLADENAAHPGEDNCKTRVTFDWNNLHNNAYQTADTIEFFFRDIPLKKVEGQIKSVSSISETESLVVSKSFVIASVNPAITVTPSIAPGDESRFINSLLNTATGQFQIVSIAQPTLPGDGPSFIVKNLVTTEVMQATPNDPVVTVPVYTPPAVNDIFFVFENISELNQWVKLTKTLRLANFSNETEIITEDDGSQHTEIVGGINGDANIEPITDVNGDTGGYTIQFKPGIDLDPHPDPLVNWIRGSARFIMRNFPDKKKRLPVISIQETNPIKIIVFDPDYFAVPDQRIQTGNTIRVNFHPSYKVYLAAEPGVFDRTKILPTGTVNNKKTYLAIRSKDATVPNYSSLTPPGVILARNIQKPVPPEAIQGPLFATRPDFYGKSTYTLDIQLNITNRIPFGLIVYRSSEMSVLQTLYQPTTVTQVVADLVAIADNDPFKFNRWTSLLEVETVAGNDNQFKLFGSYRFPNPDNNSTQVYIDANNFIRPFPLQSGETLFAKKATIKKVIEDIFSPLTETAIVYEYLKTGYQISGELPTIKSIIGRLLDPSDPGFNPFPMAVKFPANNPNTVRFTDYTLSGAARNIYFYFAREIAVDARLSDRTSMYGPIVLVDASPAEKPTIRRIITNEENPVLDNTASIEFDLAEYISSENIKQFQVFRATDIQKATTVRSMQLASVINAGDTVLDKFEDVSFPPYGQPLFYRIVALREIKNEKGETEMIPSQPSEMVLTNVIDVMNPQAPGITPVIGTTQTNGSGQVTALLNVTLQWPQTVFNGTYYLYKMNSRGNWEKLWSKKTNAMQITFPENGDFVNYPQTANLSKLDVDGNVIYHRFKVSG